jgi:hypothetical protein
MSSYTSAHLRLQFFYFASSRRGSRVKAKGVAHGFVYPISICSTGTTIDACQSRITGSIRFCIEWKESSNAEKILARTQSDLFDTLGFREHLLSGRRSRPRIKVDADDHGPVSGSLTICRNATSTAGGGMQFGRQLILTAVGVARFWHP